MSRHRSPELAFAMPLDSPAEIAVGSLLLTWERDVTTQWFSDAETSFVVVHHPVGDAELIRHAVLAVDPDVREVDESA